VLAIAADSSGHCFSDFEYKKIFILFGVVALGKVKHERFNGEQF